MKSKSTRYDVGEVVYVNPDFSEKGCYKKVLHVAGKIEHLGYRAHNLREQSYSVRFENGEYHSSIPHTSLFPESEIVTPVEKMKKFVKREEKKLKQVVARHKEELAAAKESLEVAKAKVKYMEDNNLETFNKDEFKAFQIMKLAKAEGGDDMATAKAIAMYMRS